MFNDVDYHLKGDEQLLVAAG